MGAVLGFLYSPFPSVEAARRVAQTLLAERCVACCNILPGIESHYWWEGQLTQSAEVILLCKLPHAQLAIARTRLEALHPYECPAILTLDAQVNPAFAAWATAATNL